MDRPNMTRSTKNVPESINVPVHFTPSPPKPYPHLLCPQSEQVMQPSFITME